MDLLDMPVRLVVKAPNQRVGDQTIECALGWTVRKLKTYLSEVYPSKPGAKDQKLIYSGQLLHDHLMLKDVLRQYDENSTHIVHLVCAPSRDSNGAYTETYSPPTPTQEKTPSPPVPNSSVPDQESSQPAGTEGLRHRSSQSSCTQPVAPSQEITFTGYQPSYGPTYAMPAVPGMALTPEQMTQQMFWMQQMYAQYITQYMHYVQSGTLPPQAASEAVGSPPPSNQPTPPLPNNAPPRPANENVRMNAQGGPVDDDDEEELGRNRDWLDWFYILSRAAVLFSIVYFYSSLSRFLAVTMMAAALYLYQAGWLHARPRARPAPARPPNRPNLPPGRPAAPANDDNNNRARHGAAAAAALAAAPAAAPVDEEQMLRETQEMENMMDNDIDNPLPRAEAGPSVFTVTWTFISGFFASLIPEPPAQLN